MKIKSMLSDFYYFFNWIISRACQKWHNFNYKHIIFRVFSLSIARFIFRTVVLSVFTIVVYLWWHIIYISLRILTSIAKKNKIYIFRITLIFMGIIILSTILLGILYKFVWYKWLHVLSWSSEIKKNYVFNLI